MVDYHRQGCTDSGDEMVIERSRCPSVDILEIATMASPPDFATRPKLVVPLLFDDDALETLALEDDGGLFEGGAWPRLLLALPAEGAHQGVILPGREWVRAAVTLHRLSFR